MKKQLPKIIIRSTMNLVGVAGSNPEVHET